jgi:ABC-2 type transport system ATP-binding protein
LTIHPAAEADALCDRVAIIDHGRIVVEGTPDALCDREATRALLGPQPFVREAAVA